MSDRKKTKTDGKSPGLLDILTSKAATITAVITIFSALITAAVTFRDQIVELFGTGSPVVAFPECFTSQITYPETVAVNQWDSMSLRLTGRNDCRETLAVYVAFKARRAETIQIEAPFGGDAGCEAGNPQCWQQLSSRPGDLTLSLTPPRLTLLKRPLGAPAVISINWIIYAVDTRKQIRADNVTISLVDDPQAQVGSADRTASQPEIILARMSR